MNKKCNIMLKSGVSIIVELKDDTRSVIPLWKWSVKQLCPQVLDFEEISILSTEIATIQEIVEESEI